MCGELWDDDSALSLDAWALYSGNVAMDLLRECSITRPRSRSSVASVSGGREEDAQIRSERAGDRAIGYHLELKKASKREDYAHILVISARNNRQNITAMS
jgi:hypothetical protein